MSVSLFLFFEKMEKISKEKYFGPLTVHDNLLISAKS